MHWMQSEISDAYPDSAYDGGIVEISANGGPFAQVTPTTGYPKTFRLTAGGGNPYTGPMPGQPCYGGVIPWTMQTVDLAAFAGDTIHIRFRFGTDGADTLEGWYVDDILIRGEAPIVPTPPDSVTNVVVRSSGDDIILNWSPPASGADYYVIYRNVNSEFVPEPADQIGTTTDTTFTDVGILPTSDQEYYRIIAVRQ